MNFSILNDNDSNLFSNVGDINSNSNKGNKLIISNKPFTKNKTIEIKEDFNSEINFDTNCLEKKLNKVLGETYTSLGKINNSLEEKVEESEYRENILQTSEYIIKKLQLLNNEENFSLNKEKEFINNLESLKEMVINIAVLFS